MRFSKPSVLPGPIHCQIGLTLVELMVSMAVGMLVLIAATALLMSSRSAYLVQDDSVGIQESGRHAVEIITRSLHQADYAEWDKEDAPSLTHDALSASIVGLDAHSLKSTTAGIASPSKNAINGSDILGIRFFGTGSGDHGDGTILNCAGFGIAAAASEEAEADRGWSIFYVANDNTGEPELRCKYRGKKSWSAVAIARGVESFQVLYGLDLDADGFANQYVNATKLNALDSALPLAGIDVAEKALDLNRKSYWKKVASVKIAILLRGTHGSRSDTLTKQYDLFGKTYADVSENADPGVRIQEKSLPAKNRNKMRKLFAATIQLRNQSVGSST